MQQLYPSTTITFHHLEQHTKLPIINKNLIVTYIIIAIMISIIFVDFVFKDIKAITIHKLAGISDFQIYAKFILWPIFKIAYRVLLFNAVIYLIFIRRPITQGMFYLVFNILLNAIWLILILIFSLFVYICIKGVSINLVIKNMQPLLFLERSILYIRTTILIVCLTTIHLGITQIDFLVTAYLNHSNNIERFHDLYEFGTIYFDSNYDDFYNTETLQSIHQQLLEENHAFSFRVVNPNYELNNTTFPIIWVDDSYLKNHHILNRDAKVVENTLYLPSQYAETITESQIKNIMIEIHGPLYKIGNAQIKKYHLNEPISNYDYMSSIQTPSFDKAIFYIPLDSESVRFDVHPLYFYYDDSITAQEYVDQLFAENQIKKPFEVINLKDQLVKMEQFYLRNNFFSIINILLLLILIFMSDYLQYLTYWANHRKRLYLESLENYGDYHYFNHCMFPKLVCDSICIILMWIVYSLKSGIVLGVVLMLESVFLYFVHRKYKFRKTKEKL